MTAVGICLWVGLVIVGLPLAATGTPKRRIEATRVEPGSIVVDGRADDPGWRGLAQHGGFVQRHPDDGQPATEETRVAVAHDDAALYVLVEARDRQPGEIFGMLTRRDEGSASDWIHVLLDSYDDDRTAYRFSVNPAGVRQDARLYQGGAMTDVDWDAVWYVETSRDEAGWRVELRIPFSQVRYDPEHPTWGFQIGRLLRRTNEESYFNPFPKARTLAVAEYGELAFAERLPSPWRVEAVPYVTTSIEWESEREAGETDFDWRAGGDARVGVGAAMTLDFTLNPDFGQIEADPSDLNLTAFETFFPEKRPFFLQGAEIFRFGLGYGDGSNDMLFYSRRIGRAPSRNLKNVSDDEIIDYPDRTAILAAAKLTGKTAEGWSVGILDAVTRSESARVKINGEHTSRLVEPLTNAFVARVGRDLRQGRTRVGAIVTHLARDLDASSRSDFVEQAWAGGLDLDHQVGDYGVKARIYGTHLSGSSDAIKTVQESSVHYFQRPDAHHVTLDPDATHLSGLGGSVFAGKLHGPTWRAAVGLMARTPGLNPNDLGYLPRVDQQRSYAWVQYRAAEPTSLYERFVVNFDAWAEQTFGHEAIGQGGNFYGDWVLPGYHYLYAGVGAGSESLSVTALRGGRALRLPGAAWSWYGAGSDDRKPWSVHFSGAASRRNQDAGWHVASRLELRWRPTSSVQLSIAALWRREVDGHHYVDDDGEEGKSHIIVGHLQRDTASLALRGSWALTRTLTLQAFAMPYLSAGRYARFLHPHAPRAERYADRFETVHYDGSRRFRFKELRSNLVARWAYAPASTLFVVWSHGQLEEDEDAGALAVGRDTLDLLHADSVDVVMVKLAYWFGQ